MTDVVAFDPMTPVGRYSLVSATPTEQQSEILSVIVTVTMPEPIQTIGDAIRHVLKPSGYRLARFNAQGPEVIQLLDRPLPQIHRKLGPMPLQDILLTLVSPAFRLHTDPVHRLIAYDLKNDYMEEFAP
ncbi:MAG: pili assembly chaperone [Gammaproteobacteria bacterium]|nr:pili assembly chaperone [Gammaproteobacteria bacterium]